MAQPRRSPARTGRPPSDSLDRPIRRRRLRPVPPDESPTSTMTTTLTQPPANSGWLIALAFSVLFWGGLVLLFFWLF